MFRGVEELPAPIGEPAPGFDLPDQNGNRVSLRDLRGRRSLVVFVPFPFTDVCCAELTAVRDDYAALLALDAAVVAITCDTRFANRRWAEENGFQFPVLSDFWPHGETCRRYGCFNEASGAAARFSFILDRERLVRAIVRSDRPSEARDYEACKQALIDI